MVATTADVVYGSLNLTTHVGLAVVNTPLVLCGLTADMASGGADVHISILAELWPVNVSA